MIFIHDHTFIKQNENYYTSGSLNSTLFKRYITWFKNVEVLANMRPWIENDSSIIREQNLVDNVKLTLFDKKNNVFAIYKNAHIIERAIHEQDLIVIRVPSIYGIIAVKYARKYNKPYLLEVVGCPWDALWNHSLKGKIVAPLMWLSTKLIIKNAPFALYVTNKFLQQRYPSKGKTLGCSDVALPPTDLKVFEKRLEKIRDMSPDKPILIGTTAALDVRYKGQEYVIRAISKLVSEGYNYEYHIVGPGDSIFLQSIAEKYGVSNNVKFLGSLPHEKVFEFLDEIDIYIQPSKTEGMPRALIEAMSRGCPSIGTNVGGIPELVGKDFVFKKGSVKELIVKLKKLDKQTMAQCSKTNIDKASTFNKFELDDKREKFYKTFAESLNK